MSQAQKNEIRKILRIGIIQNGQIIEERLIRRRETVTVGSSARATFVLPTAKAGRPFPLFELRGGVYCLKFRPEMRGKVAFQDAVLDLETLRRHGIAKQQGATYRLCLSEESRGKVQLDDTTLLFQFVTPPPPASKLQLPAGVRPSAFSSIDKPFFGFFLLSAFIQVGAMVGILSQDYPLPPQGLETLPDRFITMLDLDPETLRAPKKEEKVDTDLEPVEDGLAPQVVQTPTVVAKATTSKTTGPKVDSAGKITAAGKADVQSKTVLKYLGTYADGGSGGASLVDALKGGAFDVSMEDAFSGSSGVMVADASNGSRDRRIAGEGEVGSLVGIKTGDLSRDTSNTAVSSGSKTQVAIRGTMKTGNPSETFGTGELSSDKISQVVNRRKQAVQTCYERQLKSNPKLKGRVKVQFTILASGRVDNVKIIENSTGDPAVASCITQAIGSWRFPKPDGGDVTVAFPFIFAPAS